MLYPTMQVLSTQTKTYVKVFPSIVYIFRKRSLMFLIISTFSNSIMIIYYINRLNKYVNKFV